MVGEDHLVEAANQVNCKTDAEEAGVRPLIRCWQPPTHLARHLALLVTLRHLALLVTLRHITPLVTLRHLTLLVTLGMVSIVGIMTAIFVNVTDGGATEGPNLALRSARVEEKLNNTSLGVEDSTHVCLTKECVTAAAKILKNMDTSVDPCKDFFLFTCGNYLKETLIPEEKAFVSWSSVITDALQNKVKTLVEADIGEEEIQSTRMVKNLFSSCVDTDQVAKRGLDPLKEVLKELKGWPVVEGNAWDPDAFHWTTNLYKHRKLGYSIDYFFDFNVAPDDKNSTRRIIKLDQFDPGMPGREYLIKGFNDSEVQAYYQYQVSLAMLLGAERTEAEQQLKESLQFEIQLSQFSMPKEERRNVTKLYNMMTLRDLTQTAPQVPWLEYINTLLAPYHKVTMDEPINVMVPSFIRNVSLLLEKTDPRVVANYLCWRVAKDSAKYLSEDVRNLEQTYIRKITGQATREPRWKECLTDVTKRLAYAVGSLYVKRFFKEDSKAVANTMVGYIRQEFNSILQKVDWMDEETRLQALAKANAIVSYMGYPDELLQEEKLVEVYEGLAISKNDLLGNFRNLTKYDDDFSFRRLREEVDKKDWKDTGKAAVVNAFYSWNSNKIQFHAGILQGVFFDAQRPKYLNYGGIGVVIGHEITHGFDDKGRQYNANGDLVDWWGPETNVQYLKKAECIVKQYSNFIDPDAKQSGNQIMRVNGINTQGENIADNGGIKEAYYAYQEYVKDHGEESTLPGLPYSSRQLFWMSYGNLWCSKYRPEELKKHILTAPHSPPRFRVLGPLQNSKEFSQDWNCPLGSPMNPAHKCQVW